MNNKKTIDHKDITFVVQGPVIIHKNKNLTEVCTKSIRKIFPESKIIFSTWKGQDTKSLEFDRLVKNNDPGQIKTDNKVFSNINRQIVSSVNGLRKVKTNYAIKMRSDMKIYSDRFLDEYIKYEKNMKEMLFKERILITSCGSPSRYNKLFFISDAFMFGNTEDLVSLWGIPLYKDNNKSKSYELTPEEYLWQSFVKVKKDIRKFDAIDKKQVGFYESFVGNNLIIVNMEQVKVEMLKYPFHNLYEKFSYRIYSKYEWLRLYKKDNSFIYKFDFYVILKKMYGAYYKLIKNIKRLFNTV